MNGWGDVIIALRQAGNGSLAQWVSERIARRDDREAAIRPRLAALEAVAAAARAHGPHAVTSIARVCPLCNAFGALDALDRSSTDD